MRFSILLNKYFKFDFILTKPPPTSISHYSLNLTVLVQIFSRRFNTKLEMNESE